MKLLPLAFYLLVFEPEGEKIKSAAVMVALAFATFENVCYLIQNGADRFSFIFFRGFGTGAMHVLCGIIVGAGLAYTWQRTWLKIAGTCGLLGAAITLHAIYKPADCLRWCSAVHRLRPAGAAGNGGKAVCNSHITEGITEYPLLRSRFWAALNFFVNFCILGESFPEFLYLYR